MTDEAALLTAIIANRADDTPRLVFADYLENDASPLQPERGEFIRVQCELAIREKSKGPPRIVVDGRPQKCKKCRGWYGKLGRCGCEYGDRRKANQERLINERAGWLAETDELRRREWELLEAHELEWMVSPLDELVAANIADVVVNRASLNAPGWSRGFVSHITCSWSDWRTHADAILARQPIERVKLTDRPVLHGTVVYGDRVSEILQTHWEGIEFELPPEPPWERPDAFAGAAAQHNEWR